MNGTTPTTQDTPDKGRLQINLVSDISAYPIQGAQISIFYTGVPEAQLEQLTTDSSGQTDTIDLAAPPLEYSLNPENEVQPYSEYTMQITAEGFESVSIAGAEILADVTAIQNVSMKPIDTPEDEETVFVIPAHTLYATLVLRLNEEKYITDEQVDALFKINDRDKESIYGKIFYSIAPDCYTKLNTITRRTDVSNWVLETFIMNFEDGSLTEDEFVKLLDLFGKKPDDFGFDLAVDDTDLDELNELFEGGDADES